MVKTIVASPSSLVSDVKEQVDALLSIPVGDQQLLFRGKTLMDTKPLKDCGVEDRCKINLVLKKYVPKPSDVSKPSDAAPVEAKKPVWEEMRIFLRRHFRVEDVEAILQEFKKEFERNLASFSLDDIERFAISKLHPV